MNLYVIDTTKGGFETVKFQAYPDMLSYLDGMSRRQYGQSRKERMIVLEELGHGYDDPAGVNFVRSMSEAFDIGIIREDRRMRCDITAANIFNKEEYGN